MKDVEYKSEVNEDRSFSFSTRLRTVLKTIKIKQKSMLQWDPKTVEKKADSFTKVMILNSTVNMKTEIVK